MTYEEAYIKVCDGYKKGEPIKDLIEKYLYTLNPEEEYPTLSFDMWLIWACRESHDDYSNPVLVLCMAEHLKRNLKWTVGTCDSPLNEISSVALTVIDVINWFSLDDNTPPTNIIGAAVRYLFNKENINSIISGAYAPFDISVVSRLPECGVEYFPRKELLHHLASVEIAFLEKHYINPNNTEFPF